MQNELDNGTLYCNSSAIGKVSYPISFTEAPTECVSLQSPAGTAWLASSSLNSKNSTAAYNILSADKLTGASYQISFNVRGFWE